MKARIRQLTQSEFVRNVAILVTGTAGGQAITVAFSPIITRLYGPEDFGLLGVFMALVMIMAPIAALTYSTAIVLPKKDLDAKGLAWLSFYITLGMSSFIAVILFFWGDWLLVLIESQVLAPYVMLLPISMFFAGILQIAEQWLIRKKHFKIIAKVAIYKSLIVGGLQAGIGFIRPIGLVLIIVSILGTILQATMLFIGINKKLAKESVVENKAKKNHQELAKEYRSFPAYRAPQVFINGLSQNFPILMLASFFGPMAAGYYTIAMSVLNLPIFLISKSIGDVFYPRITEAKNNGNNLYKLTIKATAALVAVGFIPFLIIILFGPVLFETVFGEAWAVAGEYASWLSIWLYTMFFTTPMAKITPVINLQRLDLVFTIYKVIVRIFALYIAYILYDDSVVSVMAFSIVSAVVNVQFMVVILWRIRKYDA